MSSLPTNTKLTRRVVAQRFFKLADEQGWGVRAIARALDVKMARVRAWHTEAPTAAEAGQLQDVLKAGALPAADAPCPCWRCKPDAHLQKMRCLWCSKLRPFTEAYFYRRWKALPFGAKGPKGHNHQPRCIQCEKEQRKR